MRAGRAVAAGAAAVLAAGCAMGPSYRRPETPAAAQQSFRGQAADPRSLADLPFWDVFHDEALKALINEALGKSPSVQIAAARVEQARALAAADGWALWPGLGANTSGGRQRAAVPGLGVATFNTFGIGANASWEVDLWGRLRRTQEASQQAFIASEEAQRGVTVALIGDVAAAYFNLRALDAQKAIAEQRIAGRSKALELFQARLSRGTGNRAEVATATAQVMDAQAQLADIERRQRATENQLAVLTGSPPRQVARGAALEAQAIPPEVPAGLPSALLERRPDLRAAEAQLHAATAGIGVAVAEFYPTIQLNGSAGFDALKVGSLLTANAIVTSVGPSVSIPIFQGGRLKATLALRKAQQVEAA
ncbi:MAG TPA: efflux transporter outer membrane subunit, partial [Myxococcales bacterium]|nr:efflux transporter outer membrane subunit [Myxococcales bacterium]